MMIMLSKPKVYVTRLLPENAMNRILTNCDAKFWKEDLPPPREKLLENTEDVEGLLCLLTDKIDRELIQNAGKLRVISNLAVGFDNIDLNEASKRGIKVGITPGVLTETTADFAFSLLMACARRVVEADNSVRSGNWKTWGPMTMLGRDVFGSTLGIIGMGRIGKALAHRAGKGFQMKVIYYDVVRLDRKVEEELGIEYISLQKLLSTSDFISIHSNLTKETFHLIGRKEIDMMKRNCVLVNTARGAIVDNMALYEALKEKRIFGAALDVTEPEPIPLDHPLMTLENFIVTPHIASASVKTREKMAEIAVNNLLAGLKGERLPYPAGSS
jgi:glyoxylate reductase